MSLWTRLGFLIPVFWVLGFMIVIMIDRFFPGIIPEKMIVTLGHLIGTLFVWFFSLGFGVTKISEVVNVETGEKSIIERPHNFLMLSPLIWGVLLTGILGWFLYSPPPRSWIDVVTRKQAEIQRSIMGETNQTKVEAPKSVTKEPIKAAEMRDWDSKEGTKLRAKFVRVETVNGVKTVFVIHELDMKEKSFPVDRLSEKDLEYIKEREGK